MKLITAIIFLGIGIFGSSQNRDTICNQLPIALPETKASFSSSLENQISDALKKTITESSKFSATYKLIVDCDGRVSKYFFKQGDMNDVDRRLVEDVLKTSEWQPGIDKGKIVASTVYITIEIVAGKVECRTN